MTDQTQEPKSERQHVIKCPWCGSLKWRCWDERSEWFETPDGELYEMPVGYLACLDCNKGYINTDGNPDTHIGDLPDDWGHEFYG